MNDPTLRELAENLLAIAGETSDPELLDAARELRDVCAEHDAIGVRFGAVCVKVQQLLEAKTG